MRRSVLLIAAAVIAIVVAFAIKGKMSGEVDKKPVESVKATLNILVAKTDIPPGTFIKPEMHLDFSPRAKETIMPGYIVEGSQNPASFAGAISRSRITTGEPITNANVVKSDDGGFLSAVLSAGMRAVTVAVTPTSGNAGFIFPGDRVDVIVTRAYTKESGTAQNFSETVIRDIRVMAVDQKYTNETNEIVVARTATLEVSPKQAEILTLAAEIGKISLSLRSNSKESDNNSEVSDKPIESTLSLPFKMSITRGSETAEKEFFLKQSHD